MAYNPSPPPTRILSWQQMVEESDPEYQKRLTRPLAYVFGRRRFYAPPNPYPVSDFSQDFSQDFV